MKNNRPPEEANQGRNLLDQYATDDFVKENAPRKRSQKKQAIIDKLTGKNQAKNNPSS